MKSSQHLRAMWEHAHSLGRFPQYHYFEEWEKHELKIGKKPEDDFKEWFSELPIQQKQEFYKAFGE
jgi:hypothetical protein